MKMNHLTNNNPFQLPTPIKLEPLQQQGGPYKEHYSEEKKFKLSKQVNIAIFRQSGP